MTIKNSLKTVHGEPRIEAKIDPRSGKKGPLFGPEPGSKTPLLEGSQGVQEGEGQVKPDNRVLSLRWFQEPKSVFLSTLRENLGPKIHEKTVLKSFVRIKMTKKQEVQLEAG